jgi:predicted dehydrogenase
VSAASTALADVSLADNPFEAEVRHFVDVAEGRQEPVLTARDAVAAVQLAAAARRSAREGTPVPIEPLGGER